MKYCAICGAAFIRISPPQITCSGECSRVRQRQKQAEWFQRYKDETREQRSIAHRRWRKQNPEAEKAIAQRSYLKNHERILAYRRAYYLRLTALARAAATTILNGRRPS